MQLVRDFFLEIERRWRLQTRPDKIRLSLIGCGALLLQCDYQRGTKDSDVFETTDLLEETKTELRALAGKGTDLAARHRHYIDIVANGIPFLPHAPRWHPLPQINAQLTRFELFALDVVDVVVSKLKRFSADDQSDIDAMIDRGLVPHDRLLERFRDAVDMFSGDARASDLPKYVENLHRAEVQCQHIADENSARTSLTGAHGQCPGRSTVS